MTFKETFKNALNKAEKDTLEIYPTDKYEDIEDILFTYAKKIEDRLFNRRKK